MEHHRHSRGVSGAVHRVGVNPQQRVVLGAVRVQGGARMRRTSGAGHFRIQIAALVTL
jgi:hypothetical protein